MFPWTVLLRRRKAWQGYKIFLTALYLKYYNFGGTPSGLLSLYKFKKGWNCKDFSYNYYINCDFERIKDIEISQISKHYEFFYVFPFEKMNQKEKDIV